MSVPSSLAELPVMTCPQLLHDLNEIDYLIAALRKAPIMDGDDLDDLHWLQARRRYVLALLVARRAQRAKKIVSLDEWRTGGITLADESSYAA